MKRLLITSILALMLTACVKTEGVEYDKATDVGKQEPGKPWGFRYYDDDIARCYIYNDNLSCVRKQG